MNLELIAGGLLTAGAALFFYVGARHQRFLATPLNGRIASALGVVALVAGAIFLLRHMGSGSAIFTLVTIVMTLLTLFPFLGLLKPDAAKGDRSNG